MDKRKAVCLLEAGLLLIIIVAIRDLTPQRIESRLVYHVADSLAAVDLCAHQRQVEMAATRKHRQERGRTTIQCQLRHEDGEVSDLIPKIEIVP